MALKEAPMNLIQIGAVILIAVIVIGAVLYYLWLKRLINGMVRPFDPDLANDIFEFIFPD